MHLYTQILTQNSCYKASKYIAPRGVMPHSTGANNPRLDRYVAPDDGLLGASSSLHWNQPGVGACVHAFIGRLADGSVATYQTLPWTMRGWHCGRSGNDTHISVELCEDTLKNKDYFLKVYQEAVELAAHLCRMLGWDPLEPGVIISHAEGRKLGIASNHADVGHWFSRFGMTMDDFRADVARIMREEEEKVTQAQFDAMMDDYLARRGVLPASEWAAELLQDAAAQGITDGTRPQAFATRQEVALMVLAGGIIRR